MPSSQPAVSAIVPVYQSEQMLPDLYRRLSASLSSLTDCYEILLVEDCGKDQSWAVIEQLASEHNEVRGVRMSRNYGQHNALLCGIRLAQHPIIITLDDDLQTPPEEIGKLIAGLNDGYDVIYGTPLKQQHGLLRNLAARVTKLTLQSAMGAESACNISSFRAFRTELRESFANYRSPHVNIDVLLTWATNRFSAVAVQHEPRLVGESGYSLGALIRHALNLMTGFTTLPLRIASLLGFVFATFGLLVFSYVIIRYLIDDSAVPGFPFLASIIAIFSGVQLFAIGIIGEYLARMHTRSMERPPYHVRESTSPND